MTMPSPLRTVVSNALVTASLSATENLGRGLLAEIGEHALRRGEHLGVANLCERHGVGRLQHLARVLEAALDLGDRIEQVLDADPAVLVRVEQLERLGVDVDVVRRHRERDPQLRIEIRQREDVEAVAQADLIDRTRPKELPPMLLHLRHRRAILLGAGVGRALRPAQHRYAGGRSARASRPAPRRGRRSRRGGRGRAPSR